MWVTIWKDKVVLFQDTTYLQRQKHHKHKCVRYQQKHFKFLSYCICQITWTFPWVSSILIRRPPLRLILCSHNEMHFYHHLKRKRYSSAFRIDFKSIVTHVGLENRVHTMNLNGSNCSGDAVYTRWRYLTWSNCSPNGTASLIRGGVDTNEEEEEQG